MIKFLLCIKKCDLQLHNNALPKSGHTIIWDKSHLSMIGKRLLPGIGFFLIVDFLKSLMHKNGSVSKESACNAEDSGLIPGSGRSPGERNGNLLQDSYLENSIDRETWQAIVHGIARVGHNLATKPPLMHKNLWIILITIL